MQSLMAHFKNVFDYLFNAEWNPEYANAAHIKISRHTDARYPNEIIITAIDSDMEIHSMCAYDADIALEPMSVEYEPLDYECADCADQESIAAPGQTTKCREHQEKSDDEVDQWFIERASEFEFHPFVTTCVMCFKREAFYVGVTTHGTPFAFCRVCRDDLVRRADAAKQSPERFGV